MRSGLIDQLWVQPASGDSGGALGAALAVWHKELNKSREIVESCSMKGAFLGPSYSNDEIEKELVTVEKEIKDLKKNSISNIGNIATEISAEIIRQIINTEANKSNVSAIVNDITKKEMEKHI